MGMGLEVAEEATSKRRDAPVRAKRGEWALEEVEVRRAAWYGRAGAWKAAEGDEGADMVGEDEVSMSRQRRSGEALAMDWRLERERPAAEVQDRHSRSRSVVEEDGRGSKRAVEARQALQKKGAMPPSIPGDSEAWLGCRPFCMLAGGQHVERLAPLIGPGEPSVQHPVAACSEA